MSGDTIRTSAASTWRDYKTDGVASSGVHNPAKSDIRSTMSAVADEVDSLDTRLDVVEDAALGGIVGFASKALMDAAVASYEDRQVAHCYDSGGPPDRGVYVNDSGSSWTRTGDLPQDLVVSGSVSGDLTVSQNATIEGEIAGNDALTIEGAASFNDTLDVAGDFTAAQNASIGGDLVVTGEVTPANGLLRPLAGGLTREDYTTGLFLDDGSLVTGLPKHAATANPPAQAADIWAQAAPWGVEVVLEGRVDAYSLSAAYAGPLLRSAFWLADARIDDGEYKAKASFDRRAPPHLTGLTVTFDTSGIAVDSAITASQMFLVNYYGQSFGTAIGGTEITSAAVDAGNALTPVLSGNNSPVVAGRSYTGGLRDLREDDGESPCSGFAAKFLDLMDARGGKIKTAVISTAQGGMAMHQLIRPNGQWYPDDAAILNANFDEHMRGWRWLQKLAEEAGYAPVILPPILVSHGQEDSARPILTGPEYRDFLLLYRERVLTALAHDAGWQPGAPPMPIIASQCSRVASGMVSGSTRNFAFGAYGPTLGHYLAFKRCPGFVYSGPDYHLPAHTDDTHLSPAGQYYAGERDARAMDAVLFGRGFKPVHPFSIKRNSGTQIEVAFALPSGTLELDTTTVTDFADDGKGFFVWRLDTGAEVSLAASNPVQVTGDYTLTIDLVSDPGADLCLDYALWGDIGGAVQSPVDGPRGCVRSSTAHATTLSGGDDQYDFSLAFQEKVPTVVGETWECR